MANNQILLYRSEDGEIRLEVLHQDETLWLSQRDMATLFDKDVRTISEHIQNIYHEGEAIGGACNRPEFPDSSK